MNRPAVYAGSFDPPTRGHLDIIQRGLALFGTLIVAVGKNVGKNPIFSTAERIAMIEAECSGVEGLTVTGFDGLAVAFARTQGAHVLLRGIRSVADFESEFQMALTNSSLDAEIETVFLAPSESYAFLSSRLVKEVVLAGGKIDRFLTPAVANALETRLREKNDD